jgi:membrane protein DedA with SNARE-associated domain
MEWWHSLTAAAWWLLDEHGQLGAFLFLLVEEAGTPVPIPGDFIMVLAGARAAQGRLNLLEVLAVMELATVLGASALYWISARAGRRVVYR